MGIQKSNAIVPLRAKFRLTMFRLTRVDCIGLLIDATTYQAQMTSSGVVSKTEQK
jgi:hypothetical protein